MTTQFVQAFAKAGITMTKAERIWNFLRDKPGLTAKSISQSLKMEYISGTLHYLCKAGLVTTTDTITLDKRKAYLYYAKGVKWDSTAIAAMKAAEKAKPKAKPERVEVPELETEAGRDPYNIESLTIAEARNLYTKLKKMFG